MIITTQRPEAACNQDDIAVRALNSITSAQTDAIALIVRAAGQARSIQSVDDYDGYRSILVEPAISSDEQKAFFISGTAQRLELFEAQDDDLTMIGIFTDTMALETRLTELLSKQ